MNKQQLLELVVMQIPALVGLVWWLASVKESIRDEIDAVGDAARDKSTDLSSLLHLHIQESRLSRESLSERVSGQGKRFGAKFDRLESRIEDVLDYKVIIEKLSKIEERLDNE